MGLFDKFKKKTEETATTVGTKVESAVKEAAAEAKAAEEKLASEAKAAEEKIAAEAEAKKQEMAEKIEQKKAAAAAKPITNSFHFLLFTGSPPSFSESCFMFFLHITYKMLGISLYYFRYLWLNDVSKEQRNIFLITILSL